MSFIPTFEDFAAELAAIRRNLHVRHELGCGEVRTSAFVAEQLAAFRCAVMRVLGMAGVVGTLVQEELKHAVSVGVDMDVL